jgi:hypothetical protein
MTGLIDDTAEYWKSKDVQVRQWLSDEQGRYAFRLHVQFHEAEPAEDFFVTARKSMRTPLGAMKKLVARTQNNGGLLLVRVGDEQGAPAFYVFDPMTILKHGHDRTASDERAQRGEKWVDFHPQWGVNLWDYANGTASPTGPDGDVEPLPSDEDDQSDPSQPGVTDYGG